MPSVNARRAATDALRRHALASLKARLEANLAAKDKERVKQARDFAYSKRAMDPWLFDKGKLKVDVLKKLAELFEPC